MKVNPAIVVVAYNRAKSLQRLLSSIERAAYPSDNITLIISIDYNSHNEDVVAVAEKFTWKYGTKIVRTHEKKMGLRPHVLECGDDSKQYGCVIILEDDLVVAEDFYYYTVAAQQYYHSDSRIAGVALYCNEWNNFASFIFKPLRSPYDSYFRQVCESWGQSWTKDQWTAFRDWLENNPEVHLMDNMPREILTWPDTSWGKFFSAYVAETNRFMIIPYAARSTCFTEAGQHTTVKMVRDQVCLQNGVPSEYHFPLFEQSVHYDMFFENLDLQPYLAEWTNGEPCRIDLYGIHSEGKERYLLSTSARPFSVIHSFGLEMRPPEQNVILGIPGRDIFLYDCALPATPPVPESGMLEYNLAGFKMEEIEKYALQRYLLDCRLKLSEEFHTLVHRIRKS